MARDLQLKIRERYDGAGMLKDIRFRHVLLKKDMEFKSDSYETAIVILKGKCSIYVRGIEYCLKRKDVFTEKPSAVYISVQDAVKIKRDSEFCEIAICQTLFAEKKKSSLISKEKVNKEERGKRPYKRYVFDIISEQFDAGSMLIGETINFSGNWSSYPPHKHDANSLPYETKMEELYFFKLWPDDGFGFQRLYTKDRSIDKTLLIENNDIALIPKGYHPVCVMPGYKLYYLWILAGKNRILKPNEDSTYAWIKT